MDSYKLHLSLFVISFPLFLHFFLSFSIILPTISFDYFLFVCLYDVFHQLMRLELYDQYRK